MALATRLSAKTESGGVLIRYAGGEDQFGTAKTNGADIFLTAGITFQNEAADEDVDLVAAGEHVAGVVVGTAWPNLTDLSKDSDSPYADNVFIRYYRPIAGDLLYATLTTAETLGIDSYAKYSGGFITTSTRADSNVITREAVTGASATEAIIPVEWVKS
jgi:hypothetical protein